MILTEVTIDEDFRALRAEWSDLLEADPRATVFQTWEFQYHASKMVAESIRPLVLLFRNAVGQLVGCVPLGESTWKVGPLRARVLGFNGGMYVDYNTILARPQHAAEVVGALAGWLQEARGRCDVVRLRNLREDSWLLEHRETLLSGLRPPVQLEPSEVAPYLELRPEWRSYRDALPAKRGRRFSYEVRKILRCEPRANIGAVTAAAEIEEAMGRFFALHQKRLHEKKQLGRFGRKTVRDGFRGLVRALHNQGRATLWQIRLDDRVVSSLCTFEFRGVCSYYQGGYDPAIRRLSPGTVSIATRIDRALADGCHEYDFLVGDDRYKNDWATGRRTLLTLELPTGSWRGALYRGYNRLYAQLTASERLRELFLRLRPPVEVPHLLD